MRVQHSIPAPEAIAEEAGRAYELGAVLRCVLIRSWTNDVFGMGTAAGPHVLKVYRQGWRSEGEIRWELALITHLAARGAPVVPPTMRRNGEAILPLQAPEGIRHAVLFRAAPGGPPRRPFSPELFWAYGEAAGRLHRAGEGFGSGFPRPAHDLDDLIWNPLRAIAARLGHRPEDLAFLNDLAERLAEGIAGLAARGLAWGPCHGDVSLDNLHVTADGRITFYDFDLAGPGWLAWDIAGAMQGVHPDDFAAGYRTILPLDETATAALPLFAAASHLQQLGDDCGRWALWVGEDRANDRNIDEQLAWLRRWAAERGD